MARRNLQAFLKRLDKQLKSSSEAYRRETANKLVHVFLYKESTISGVLKTLLQQSTMTKGGLSSEEDLADRYEQATRIIEGIGPGYQELLNTLSSKLAADFTRISTKEGVSVKISRNGKVIVARVLEAESVRGKRDNFNLIRNTYKDNLNDFYKKFLKLLGKRFIKVHSSTSKTGFRKVSTAGRTFNLEHTQRNSNIKAFINDATVEALGNAFEERDIAELQAALRDANLENLSLSITKNLKTQQVSVFIGSQIKNVKESKKEKNLFKELETKLKAALNELGTEIISTPGSDSIREGFRKKTVNKTLAPFKKVKSLKVRQENTTIKGAISKASKDISSKVSIAEGSKSTIRKKGTTTRAQKGVSSAPLHLIGIMNEQLPEVIQRNMDTPALENRTGRFASSVRVTDISMTAGGFPSIGYTYMKEPYQTFEPGYRQGSIERDPRRLIDKSMREIALQYAIGRFYTRRV